MALLMARAPLVEIVAFDRYKPDQFGEARAFSRRDVRNHRVAMVAMRRKRQLNALHDPREITPGFRARREPQLPEASRLHDARAHDRAAVRQSDRPRRPEFRLNAQERPYRGGNFPR